MLCHVEEPSWMVCCTAQGADDQPSTLTVREASERRRPHSSRFAPRVVRRTMLNPGRDHRPPNRRYIQTSSFAPKLKRPGTGPRLGIRTPRVPRGVVRMAGSANVESVPPPNLLLADRTSAPSSIRERRTLDPPADDSFGHDADPNVVPASAAETFVAALSVQFSTAPDFHPAGGPWPDADKIVNRESDAGVGPQAAPLLRLAQPMTADLDRLRIVVAAKAARHDVRRAVAADRRKAQGRMRWITVGPPGQPDTSILLAPPVVDPGVTDDERRIIR